MKILILTLLLVASFTVYGDEAEDEFKKILFFSKSDLTFKPSKLIKIKTSKVRGSPGIINIEVEFEINRIQRILVLQPKTKECQSDPTIVKNYLLGRGDDRAIGVSFNSKTTCNINEVTYLFFLRGVSNILYTASVKINDKNPNN